MGHTTCVTIFWRSPRVSCYKGLSDLGFDWGQHQYHDEPHHLRTAVRRGQLQVTRFTDDKWPDDKWPSSFGWYMLILQPAWLWTCLWSKAMSQQQLAANLQSSWHWSYMKWYIDCPTFSGWSMNEIESSWLMIHYKLVLSFQHDVYDTHSLNFFLASSLALPLFCTYAGFSMDVEPQWVARIRIISVFLL